MNYWFRTKQNSEQEVNQNSEPVNRRKSGWESNNIGRDNKIPRELRTRLKVTAEPVKIQNQWSKEKSFITSGGGNESRLLLDTLFLSFGLFLFFSGENAAVYLS